MNAIDYKVEPFAAAPSQPHMMEGDGALPSKRDMEAMIDSQSRWDEVEEAVDHGFDTSTVFYGAAVQRLPLLSHCIYYGCPACPDSTIDCLVKNGADASATDNIGRTVFHFAADLFHKSEEESERLLRKLASLPSLPPHLPHQPANDGALPTCGASTHNNVRGLRVLVEELGVSVSAADEHGRTPAHWASLSGHREALLYLIVFCGVDVTAKTNVSAF